MVLYKAIPFGIGYGKVRRFLVLPVALPLMNLPKQPQALEADVKGAIGIGVLGHVLRGAAGIEELAFPVFYAR